MISDDLLAIIACPKCKGELEYNETKAQFICHKCRLIYKIENDIPNMLIDDAEPF